MTTSLLSRIDIVRQLVRAHVPAEALERLAVEQTLSLLAAVDDPFARATLRGHITGSAVVLDEAGEHVLLVWHHSLGRYLQPGGHSEPGDATPLETAIRETTEETGVRVGEPGKLVHVDVHTIPVRGPEAAHRHHDLRFVFVVAADAAPRLPLGSRTSGWVRVKELDAYDVDPSFRRALESATRSASLNSESETDQTSRPGATGIG
ncbi:MAG TPA: NUDIX domain-containing protein [Gemmatimonadaceae bacterium]|nr:NUDIX domain-containing protein [Gemmatimonadaceae bacterium]